jgi:hypothetical protein
MAAVSHVAVAGSMGCIAALAAQIDRSIRWLKPRQANCRHSLQGFSIKAGLFPARKGEKAFKSLILINKLSTLSGSGMELATLSEQLPFTGDLQ